MTHRSDRREFLRTLTTATLTAATSGLALSHPSFSAPPKSLLVFTKSSGFEHEVVKRKDGKLSIAETAVTELGQKMASMSLVPKTAASLTPKIFTTIKPSSSSPPAI